MAEKFAFVTGNVTIFDRLTVHRAAAVNNDSLLYSAVTASSSGTDPR